MRSLRDNITFHYPITLPGFGAELPAGTYMVLTEEEEIPSLSFIAWRGRVATQIYLPAIGLETGQEQVVTIDPKDISEARKRDTAKLLP
ncbi:hypothetical protein [Aestuariivirga sp.]|uniref:hypothetical protein n=1 Tax=Aestuariivirga sp. TaxID=2650926 RepID=UPI00391A8386